MAGIGWKLQRLIDRGSLAGTLGAYLTGVAVTSAPWLLTTAVLTTLRLLGGAASDFSGVDRLITLVYAVTVVASAPMHVVVSRYASDRVYDRRLELLGAPLRLALGVTLAGSAALGAVLMAILRVPGPVAIVGTVLTATVGAGWLLLSVGGSLASPVLVLRAFGIGAPLSVLLSLMLERWFGGGDLGYLLGFLMGQLATVALLLRAIAQALPPEIDENARLWPAFSEYRLLALSALTFNLAIWADKALVWLVAGQTTGALYSSMAALAWFSAVPTFGWIYVQIETVFYDRFRTFYDDVDGGVSLDGLTSDAQRLFAEASQVLTGAATIQASATVIVLLFAGPITRAVGLPPQAVGPFRWMALGAALQVLTLLELLLLYYFDLRREAFAVSLALLLAEAGLVLAARAARLPLAMAYPAACATAALMGRVLVHRRLSTLLTDTFQSQPYGREA